MEGGRSSDQDRRRVATRDVRQVRKERTETASRVSRVIRASSTSPKLSKVICDEEDLSGHPEKCTASERKPWTHLDILCRRTLREVRNLYDCLAALALDAKARPRGDSRMNRGPRRRRRCMSRRNCRRRPRRGLAAPRARNDRRRRRPPRSADYPTSPKPVRKTRLGRRRVPPLLDARPEVKARVKQVRKLAVGASGTATRAVALGFGIESESEGASLFVGAEKIVLPAAWSVRVGRGVARRRRASKAAARPLDKRTASSAWAADEPSSLQR